MSATKSFQNYHDLDSVPSLPSYQPVATSFPPKEGPATVSAPQGDSLSSMETPVENQAMEDQFDPLGNENTGVGSDYSPE